MSSTEPSLLSRGTRLNLPNPRLPDIDILIRDDKSSAILIGELKWLRKVIRAIEHLNRDAEPDEGFQQLTAIGEFLEGNPTIR